MIRRWGLLFLFCLALALTGGTFIEQPHAYACNPYWSTCGSPCDPYWGTCGYFYNTAEGTSTICNVLPSATSYCQNNGSISGSSCVGDCSNLFGVTNINTFVNDISANPGGYLYQPALTTSYQYNSEIGAAYIIDFMMNMTGFHSTTWGGGIALAKSNLPAWQALVRAYATGNTCVGSALGIQCPGAANYGINWKYTPSFSNFCSDTYHTLESEYDPTIPDVAEWPASSNETGTSLAHCTTAYNESLPEIVFYWTNGDGSLGTMSIGTMCGNMQGSPTGPMPTPIQLSCGGASVVPTSPDPYMRFGVTVSIQSGGASPPPAGTFALTVTPPRAGGYAVSNLAMAGVVSGLSESATYAGLGPPNIAGVFTLKWVFTPTGLPAAATCTGSFNVVYLPYVNVYGGDTMVGASPDYANGSSSCQRVAAAPGVYAGAYSWNNHSTDFSGAGSEYSVTALGSILDYASALSSSNSPPTGLSFANVYNPPDVTKRDPSQGLFGGYFGDLSGVWTGSCDFTSDITTTAVPGAAANTTIAALPNPLANGTQTVVYASGDVYIGRNIAYNTSGWTKPSDIPSFKLVVVGGDIYINSNVTQLDGLYVSESSSGVGGRIFTCATAPSTPALPSVAGYYATCNKQLVVNGSFVATEVWLGRTYGSIGLAKAGDTVTNNHDAEVFNYTPELWLPRGYSTPSNNYQAIVGLPPVL